MLWNHRLVFRLPEAGNLRNGCDFIFDRTLHYVEIDVLRN